MWGVPVYWPDQPKRKPYICKNMYGHIVSLKCKCEYFNEHKDMNDLLRVKKMIIDQCRERIARIDKQLALWEQE